MLFVSLSLIWHRLGRVGCDLHHGHGVVVKDGGDIFRGELVGCVGDEQAGLADCTVPHHDTPARGIWGQRVQEGRLDYRNEGGGVEGGEKESYLMVATTMLLTTSSQAKRMGKEQRMRKVMRGKIVWEKRERKL